MLKKIVQVYDRVNYICVGQNDKYGTFIWLQVVLLFYFYLELKWFSWWYIWVINANFNIANNSSLVILVYWEKEKYIIATEYNYFIFKL
jgi:hypothetical protein